MAYTCVNCGSTSKEQGTCCNKQRELTCGCGKPVSRCCGASK